MSFLATTALHPLPAENVLIPTAEISKYTGIAKQTHNRWRHQGTGPKYIHLGRRVFYLADDIRSWIDSNYQPTTQLGKELNQLDTRLDVSND